MLFNEPKLLKSYSSDQYNVDFKRFSALQRAEIAEMREYQLTLETKPSFSALQRAEIAEMYSITVIDKHLARRVSVLFNEPKLLKYRDHNT